MLAYSSYAPQKIYKPAPWSENSPSQNSYAAFPILGATCYIWHLEVQLFYFLTTLFQTPCCCYCSQKSSSLRTEQNHHQTGIIKSITLEEEILSAEILALIPSTWLTYGAASIATKTVVENFDAIYLENGQLSSPPSTTTSHGAILTDPCWPRINARRQPQVAMSTLQGLHRVTTLVV